MNVSRPLFAVFLSLVSCAVADWPQYRGADGQGVSAEAVPVTWSATKNMKWKCELPGAGSSSPVVVGDKVFVTCYSGVKEGEERPAGLVRHLVCVDRKTGKIMWDQKVPNPVTEDPYRGFLTEHGYASNTPVVSGGKVFAFFGKSGVYAYDLEGKLLWERSVGTDSASKLWGSAASPVVVDGTLVINASDEAKTVFGFDPETGEEKWKVEDDGLDLAYGTPVAMNVGGRTDLVLAQPGELWGRDPATGEKRWWTPITSKGNISPSPVLGDGVVYVFGGYPSLRRSAVKVGSGEGELPAGNTLWEDNDSSYVPTPVLVDGHLYWASDSGYALCVDAASGKTVYKERLKTKGGKGKPFYAGAVAADGKVIAVSRTAGTFVFEAKPKFKLLSTNVIKGDDSRFQGTPAIVRWRAVFAQRRSALLRGGGMNFGCIRRPV